MVSSAVTCIRPASGRCSWRSASVGPARSGECGPAAPTEAAYDGRRIRRLCTTSSSLQWVKAVRGAVSRPPQPRAAAASIPEQMCNTYYREGSNELPNQSRDANFDAPVMLAMPSQSTCVRLGRTPRGRPPGRGRPQLFLLDPAPPRCRHRSRLNVSADRPGTTPARRSSLRHRRWAWQAPSAVRPTPAYSNGGRSSKVVRPPAEQPAPLYTSSRRQARMAA